jgi:hypothetical protein
MKTPASQSPAFLRCAADGSRFFTDRLTHLGAGFHLHATFRSKPYAIVRPLPALMTKRASAWPCTPCQLEGCERRLDNYSQCLDELSPQQVIAAVDQAPR